MYVVREHIEHTHTHTNAHPPNKHFARNAWLSEIFSIFPHSKRRRLRNGIVVFRIVAKQGSVFVVVVT